MKKSISIIGGGSAAIVLAAFLDAKKYNISIYEQNKSLGNKFLVAGKGGFNLTHAEAIAQMIERYTPADFLREALQGFSNEDLRKWLQEIGIPTFVGSSNRVYPKRGIKPSKVLSAITNILNTNKVQIKHEHCWTGWDAEGAVLFNDKTTVKSDYTVFALGGGSWKVTGSDGLWKEKFDKKGIDVLPFQASNCAYMVNWDSDFVEKYQGDPLKNIALSCDEKTKKGELIITKDGLEGIAIYALSPQIRNQLNSGKTAFVYLDMKPTMTREQLLSKVFAQPAKSTSDILRQELKLSGAQRSLLKTYLTKEEYLNKGLLVKKIKNFPIEIVAAGNIDEAISTVGGVKLSEVDENFQLKKVPHHYCIGEMLDWDAPTGGYLLQACFSMGVKLARCLNNEF